MNYKGHYNHAEQVVMSYSIDDRAILEAPAQSVNGLAHTMQIMGGRTVSSISGTGAGHC